MSEILTGPSARLILRSDHGRWTCVVDAEAMRGPFATMSGAASPPGGSPTRSDAVARAAGWIRRFLGPNLHPAQDAWLSSLTAEQQPDLFAA